MNIEKEYLYVYTYMMNLFESAVDDMTQEELLDIQSGKSATTVPLQETSSVLLFP